MSIPSKVRLLANLTDEAYEKLINAMSMSLMHLKNEITETTYTLYISIPEDNHDDYNESGYIPDESLTANQLLRRNIETAQACFLLYYGLPFLKELILGSVMLNSQTFGKGELNPSDVKELAEMRKLFLNTGKQICTNMTLTGDVRLIVI